MTVPEMMHLKAVADAALQFRRDAEKLGGEYYDMTPWQRLEDGNQAKIRYVPSLAGYKKKIYVKAAKEAEAIAIARVLANREIMLTVSAKDGEYVFESP